MAGYGMGCALFIAFLLQACGPADKDRASNTAGSMRLSVDATLEPLIEQEIRVFTADYPNAEITPRYVSEQEAIRDVMLDSAMAAVTTRPLTEKQKEQFLAKYRFNPREEIIAVDAVALILNKSNQDTLLDEEEIIGIFTGDIRNWNELDHKEFDHNIEIVFDNPYSSTVEAMKKYTGINRLDSSRMFAVNTNKEVISYVEKKPGALGVIGVNWVSQPKDSVSQAFLKSIHMVGIAPAEGKPGYGKYYKPHQAYLAQKVYPIRRNVYYINRGPAVSLGTGFAAFLGSQRGQLIVMRSGLLPAQQPVRLIQME